jgi:hypothetical protein
MGQGVSTLKASALYSIRYHFTYEHAAIRTDNAIIQKLSEALK